MKVVLGYTAGVLKFKGFARLCMSKKLHVMECSLTTVGSKVKFPST